MAFTETHSYALLDHSLQCFLDHKNTNTGNTYSKLIMDIKEALNDIGNSNPTGVAHIPHQTIFDFQDPHLLSWLAEARLDGVIIVKFSNTILGDFHVTTWTLKDTNNKELWILSMPWECKPHDDDEARVQLEFNMTAMAAVHYLPPWNKERVFGCIQTKCQVIVYCCTYQSLKKMMFDVWHFASFTPANDDPKGFIELILFLLQCQVWWLMYVYPWRMAAVIDPTQVQDKLAKACWASADFDPNVSQLLNNPWSKFESNKSLPPSVAPSISSSMYNSPTWTMNTDGGGGSGSGDKHGHSSSSGHGWVVSQNPNLSSTHLVMPALQSLKKFLPHSWRRKNGDIKALAF
ncbi:hypothetical protein K435DRAFT_805359 [Dendrothele bispora CBS 962.96]|uniref:Uncharacterized protein n=1 Tax=Dendrothele bispora (strain CBS 962.96) TaxID=1314807 RepID=A0A4S8LBS7_DENBC|nr:hypothetical protein K435DRAFT_805359 [Dendrothele bispora CBS 962.96]